MANKYEDDEIECEIIEAYGVFSAGYRNWNKEVNLVSWNGRPAKLDIRAWQSDHEKCGKGIALTREEAEELVKLLGKILKKKSAGSQQKAQAKKSHTSKNQTSKDQTTKSQSSKSQSSKTKTSKTQASRKIIPPRTLEPFYHELEVFFGAGPDKCKSARNTLLKKYHPDKNAENIEFATRKTIKIKEAYDKIIEWWNAL